MDDGPRRQGPYQQNWTGADRGMARTPSPTPSEHKALTEDKMSMIDTSKMKQDGYWKDPKHIIMAIVVGLAVILGILFLVFEKKIIHFLHPATQWMHDLPAGWLIPIGIMFVLSFPPLGGHEIVAILCGVVWGVGIGFGIVAAGTVLGELGNFYAFRFCLRGRFEKEERKNIFYACLARVVREGGFKIALISRYSVIPGHMTTAIYSTCGISVWIFLAAAVLSLPKQFILILIGTFAENSDSSQPAPKYQKWVSTAVFIVTGVVTIAAWRYINREIQRVKPAVIYARRKARQAQMWDAAGKRGVVAEPEQDAFIRHQV